MGVLQDIAKRGKLIVFIGTTSVCKRYNLPDFLLMDIDAYDDETLLAQALALSKETGEDVDASATKANGSAIAAEVPDDEEMSEEEAIAKAIAISMQEDQEDRAK